jgi:AraC family transcriptional regulator
MVPVVPPGVRATNPLAAKTAALPLDKGGGGARKRPEQLIGEFWHQTPQHAAHSVDSGISAAIWGGGSGAPEEHRRPALDNFHVLAVRLQDFRAERWHDGHLVREQDSRIGSFCLTFAGTEPRGIVQGPWRLLQVYMPTTLLVETAQQVDVPPLGADHLEPGLTYDPILHAIGGNIVSEIEQHRPGSRLQLDSLGIMICVQLLRRAGSASRSKQVRGGLARWQIKRAMECIAERLEDNLTLAALAQEVGLSQYHFARAFKQSTGLTPHRYLLHCRLKRAKALLAETDASVADIAARVGYNEATQLSRLFQAELAISPSTYRRMSAGAYNQQTKLHADSNPARNVSS